MIDHDDLDELDTYLQVDGSVKAEHLMGLAKIARNLYFLSNELDRAVENELTQELDYYRKNATINEVSVPQRPRKKLELTWKQS